MKKFFLILFGLFFCFSTNAKASDLYDVNFDAPKNIQIYNEKAKVFQDIYLQYEDAIRKIEESIRNEEKNVRKGDVQKFQEELSLEREKAQENLIQSLEKQKQEIYAKEIEQLRKEEHEKLSQELHEIISKELSEKYSSEYENKVEQKIEELTQEYEKRFQEKSEELTKEYDARIAEYEKQKKAEIKEYKKEYKKMVLEETNAITKRIQILTPYIALFLAFVVVFLICFLIFRKIIKKIKKKKEIDSYKREFLDEFNSSSNAKKYDYIVEQIHGKIKILTDKNEQKLQNEALQLAMEEYKPIYEKRVIDKAYSVYFNDLQRVGSKNVYLNKVKDIQDDINNSDDTDYVKNLKYEALEKAKKEFSENIEVKTIEDYDKIFKSFDLQHQFNTWNGLEDDVEAKRGLISDFSFKAADFLSIAREAVNSKNDKESVSQLLKKYAPKLKNYFEQLKRMSESETSSDLKQQLLQISQQYETLHNQFENGVFNEN